MQSLLVCRRSRSLGTYFLVGQLVGGLLLSACSKGGAGDPVSCRKLSDPVPGLPSSDRPIARSLYAELKSPSGVYSTVPLEGIGGVYSGMKPLTKCEERANTPSSGSFW